MGTMGMPTDVVLLSGVRTPFGTFGGSLRDVSAVEHVRFVMKGGKVVRAAP